MRPDRPSLTLAFACALVFAACGGDSSSGDPDAAPTTADAASTAADAAAPATDAAPAGDAGCVPSAPATEVCDAVDNDCNGFVDDVDVGMDGLYDCQGIALFGTAGASGSSNFVAWLNSNGSDVVRLQDSAGAGAPTLTAELLAMYDVIILDNLVRVYTAEEATLLRDWVAGGGGLVVLSGYTGGSQDYDEPNSLLTGIGLAILPGLRGGPVTTFEAHPVTQGITSVTFSGGFNVAPVDGVTGGVNTVVASLVSGPVGIVQERGAGRVFVWGDEWITFDSEWSSMPQIQAFWANILGWLGGFV